MHASEFDEAWEDDFSATEREEQELGQVILGAPIRELEPPAAVLVPETASIESVIQTMLDRGLGAVLVQREGPHGRHLHRARRAAARGQPGRQP